MLNQMFIVTNTSRMERVNIRILLLVPGYGIQEQTPRCRCTLLPITYHVLLYFEITAVWMLRIAVRLVILGVSGWQQC